MDHRLTARRIAQAATCSRKLIIKSSALYIIKSSALYHDTALCWRQGTPGRWHIQRLLGVFWMLSHDVQGQTRSYLLAFGAVSPVRWLPGGHASRRAAILATPQRRKRRLARSGRKVVTGINGSRRGFRLLKHARALVACTSPVHAHSSTAVSLADCPQRPYMCHKKCAVAMHWYPLPTMTTARDDCASPLSCRFHCLMKEVTGRKPLLFTSEASTPPAVAASALKTCRTTTRHIGRRAVVAFSVHQAHLVRMTKKLLPWKSLM